MSGAEVASTSFSSLATSGKTNAELLLMATAVAGLFSSNVWTQADLTFRWPGQTTFLGARVSEIDSTGHVTRSAENILSSPQAGTASGNPLPPEVAVVASLRTDTAGPRGRGRMYLPGLAANQLTSTGGVDPTAVGKLATQMAAYFTALNSSTDFDSTVVVASGAAGVLYDVRSVRVGNVYDAQRRRRNRIVESYQSHDV